MVDFYTQQLGGSVQDLDLARKLAPVVKSDIRHDDKDHPLKTVLQAAFDFNAELVAKGNPYILIGDPTYRAILGLRVDSEKDRIENKIDSQNVQAYLDHSYEFLLSFLKHDDQATLDTPYQLSEAFIVYRTLLIKQLASLADPNNQHVKKGVRAAIEKFVNEKLHLDPQVVFNNALNQALFVDETVVNPRQMKNPISVSCSVAAVTDVTKAIMTDLAYDSAAVVTPKMLIEEEAQVFLHSTARVETMFAYKKAAQELSPEATPAFAKRIKVAIVNTQEFIKAIAEKQTLINSGARDIYIKSVINQVEEISLQITNLEERVGVNSDLTKAKQALVDFARQLRDPQPMKGVERPVIVAVPRDLALDDFIKDARNLSTQLLKKISELQQQTASRNGFLNLL
ncbi:hypothetical protein [Legionella tunisiensis]|uniref:hypothetical protein n=1 Tax=Legionella tunisiensis TaxID=1034944 RepID=UPI0002E8EE6A|nr:hypothetical protein [Legionella tunisiensis]